MSFQCSGAFGPGVRPAAAVAPGVASVADRQRAAGAGIRAALGGLHPRGGRGSMVPMPCLRLTRLIAALALMLAAAPAIAGTGVTISGDARMGVTWDSGPSLGPAESGLRLTSRMRIRLHFEGETDGGLRYGAQIRLDEAAIGRTRSFLRDGG